MTQSLQARSIEEIDIRKEVNEFPGHVFWATKIRRRIVDRYDLALDQRQEHSLGTKIGEVLSIMFSNGEIYVYSRGGSHHAIKYARKQVRQIAELNNYFE